MPASLTQASLPCQVSIHPRVPAPRLRTRSTSSSRSEIRVRAGADWASHTHRIVRSHTRTGTHPVSRRVSGVRGSTIRLMMPPVLMGSR